ncbi:MAG: hypothetical protein U5S82_05920 [Gammaproteobacteria bacterium]|nr:hypothetical protein [Gammaproteobacteria bacterium]
MESRLKAWRAKDGQASTGCVGLRIDGGPALKRVLSHLKLGFLVAAVGFIAYAAKGASDELDTLLAGAAVSTFCLAVLAWYSLHFISPVFSLLALRACGTRVGYRLALINHASRLPARYLPGGIWHLVAKSLHFHEQGVKVPHITVLFLLEQALAISVTFLLGGAALWLVRGWEGWGAAGFLGASGATLLLLLMPLGLNRLVLTDGTGIRLLPYLKVVATVVLFWLVATMAFLLYMSGFPSLSMETSVADLGGSYLFSWGVGYLAFFAPQGVGVFEASLAGMLDNETSFQGLLVVVAGFRLVALVADIAAWLTAMALQTQGSRAS